MVDLPAPDGPTTATVFGWRSLRMAGEGRRIGIYGFGAAAHIIAQVARHQGRELIVHRKGATPAGAGVLGVIPGTMADPAFVVRAIDLGAMGFIPKTQPSGVMIGALKVVLSGGVYLPADVMSQPATAALPSMLSPNPAGG